MNAWAYLFCFCVCVCIICSTRQTESQGVEWPHGPRKVHHVIRSGVLTSAVTDSFHPADPHNYAIFLEDDVEVRFAMLFDVLLFHMVAHATANMYFRYHRARRRRKMHDATSKYSSVLDVRL